MLWECELSMFKYAQLVTSLFKTLTNFRNSDI